MALKIQIRSDLASGRRFQPFCQAIYNLPRCQNHNLNVPRKICLKAACEKAMRGSFQEKCYSLRQSGTRGLIRSAASSSGTAPIRDIAPIPVVKIDNLSDAFATVVTVQYGKLVGEVLDTITALKNSNLNIRRASLSEGDYTVTNKFLVTEAATSEKILKSARLEEIRMIILNTLKNTFPESFTTAAASGGTKREENSPLGLRCVVPTQIQVTDTPSGAASVLKITTPDRPGLLVDIVRVLKDINLNVVSAEVDTVGDQAHDQFFVTYHGGVLSTPMQALVQNALQYYLSLREVATEESY